MFEWADGGNLLNLWKTPNQPLTPSLVKATIKQLLGLASALCAAHYPQHGPTFRHGDLKPANILWFKDGDSSDGIGTLKIADWGLAKEHNILTVLRTNKTSTEYGTRRYEPPEEETGLGVSIGSLTPGEQPVGKKRSRLYDIWAMGCITLEFIVWLLHGPDGLRRFNHEVRLGYSDGGPFYQTRVENGVTVARVHDVAVEWMNRMAKDPRCQVGRTALGDLLELVQTRLLVVAMPDRLGTSEWSPMSNLSPMERSGTSMVHGLPTPVSPGGDIKLPPATEVPGIVVSGPESSLRQRPAPPPSPDSFSGSGRRRAHAKEFKQRMEHIYLEADSDSYWLPDEPEPALSPALEVVLRDKDQGNLEDTGRSLRTSDRQRRVNEPSMATGRLTLPSLERVDYGNYELDNIWERSVDNELAAEIFSAAQRTSAAARQPEVVPSSNLCKTCQTLRDGIWEPAFSQSYQHSHLEAASEARSCDLCGLLWRACQRLHATKASSILVKREGSYIKLNSIPEPALSILRSPDLSTPIDNVIQIGFPGSIQAASPETQFEIIRKWLSHCDAKHACCRPPPSPLSDTQANTNNRLPTRLIEVGQPGDSHVRLIETEKTQPHGASTGASGGGGVAWFALSHQWGPGPHFLTTTSNLAVHLRGIAVDALPATFRDAVRVTRAAGCAYLWIDSLCIVQGPDGDFNREAKRMEHVYSGAACVLAVSRGGGGGGGDLSSGFLHPRRAAGADFVALRRTADEGRPGVFYVCENVDDFNGHVLEGTLSRRGWVLQEHALARRTVFFTDWQMYWECGEGVRCETMVRMKNKLAAFLGDAKFPQILMDARQGERILRVQDLYKRYSRLELTNAFDRPVAIDGLQARILSALKSRGGLGVLDEGPGKKGLLRRSLLWHRADQTARLDRIVFPAARAISVVPSWSWMAYTGAIDYISPEFGSVEWEEMQSPWSGRHSPLLSEGQGGNIALVAKARQYDPFKAKPEDTKLVFDSPGLSEQGETLCVVLGQQTDSMRRTYLILVRSTAGRDRNGSKIYERVGAGYLPGNCIGEERGMVTIH
ncbi:1c852c8e-3c27-4064-b4f6-a4ad5c015261 [Thermothielavioides terrestris]|uniref:1c852c8e-3c27-4064-b4f6-a4ad5c015261 n=1 Tax=Thermothielavioides terrestris TaxID=2587410 RepID=A0A3S4F4X3_9PEZI|nr:1c852c8e-3c27-4064-b4f6-a4ad5c015261 [Thermothielavioides terrestris]